MRDLLGGIINSSDLALAYAALLLKEHYGENVLEQQKPFRVESLGPTWRVVGSQRSGPPPWGDDALRQDSFVMEVRKSDGQVLRFVIEGHFMRSSKTSQ